MTGPGTGGSVSDTQPARFLRVFWERAYRENITGLSAMIAYNLALALFPFALLILFIFGQVIKNPDVEASVLRDLQSLFPAAEQSSLTTVVDRIRDSSTTIGVVAAVGAIWIGASFWGAMDTAFCRIYHVECRGWVEQKRFALVMLVVVTIFLAASVLVPVAEGVLTSSADSLPFGLDDYRRRAQRARARRGAAGHLRGLLADLLRRPEGPRALARRLARGPVRHLDHRDRERDLPVLPRPVQHRPARRRARIHPRRAGLVLPRQPRRCSRGR